MTLTAIPALPEMLTRSGVVAGRHSLPMPQVDRTPVRYASRSTTPYLLWMDLSFATADPLPEERPDNDPPTESLFDANGQVNEHVGCVEVVEQLTSMLAVPRGDVLAAAGISKRTFQHWKKNPAVRPRLDSQGRVWELRVTADMLKRALGEDVAAWLAADRERRKLLKAGAFDALLRLAAERPLTSDQRVAEEYESLGYFVDDPMPLDAMAPRRVRQVAKVTPARRVQRTGQ